LVDAESIEARLSRLAELLDELEQIRADGRLAYLSDFRTRLATQHALQLAVQTCIDIGAHLIAELNLTLPSDYRGIFTALLPTGLDAELGDRLGRAAGMRNILVHDYLDLDHEVILSALESLEDLRRFAAFVESRLD
jgi:uncharacterized protein YutE (UPF0331/DUF86 family)